MNFHRAAAGGSMNCLPRRLSRVLEREARQQKAVGVEINRSKKRETR